MSEEFSLYAFSAGELSPSLFMRADLEKYDLGVGLARNFFVDYRGGLATRPGMHFADFLKADDTAIKIKEFRFAPEVEDAYLMIFGHQYVRFMQGGAYITETGVAITDITSADPGVITSAGHGFSDGDWVIFADILGTTKLNGRTGIVANATTDTFTVQDIAGVDISTISSGLYLSGGTASRVYTVTTPYDEADLEDLKVYQRQDQVSLTHVNYAPRTLTRSAAASWTLAIDAAVSPLDAPTGLALSASSIGDAGVMFQVTAVDAEGNESLPCRGVILNNIVNYTQTEGSAKATWTAVDGAKYYNVYRSLVKPDGDDVTLGDDVGFVGRAFGPQFTDPNIVPDFAYTPPYHSDPFVDGAITSVSITAEGSGYAVTATMTVSGGGGSGFVGYPVVNDSGEIISVIILHPGSGYSSPTVSFSGGGSGATATATAGAAEGNYPATVSIFEQRKVYGGSLNYPMTVWGTKPGDYDNHDVSIAGDPSDAYNYTIDDNEVAPIRHLMPLQNGLLVASASRGWLLRGADDSAVNAISAKADSISFDGFSKLVPLRVNNDVLFAQDGGKIVQALVLNQFSGKIGSEEISTLSNHLFKDYEIKSWGYAPAPLKIIWGQRSDGKMLALTYVRDQKVFAWTQLTTKGFVLAIETVREGDAFVTYLVSRRYINGRWTKFIEYFDQRDFSTVEEAWCLDAALELGYTSSSVTLTVGAATGTGVTVTAVSSVFTAEDVGSVIRGGGGKAVIVSYVSGTEVVVDVLRDFTDLVSETTDVGPVTSWTLAVPTTTVYGLWHLEGETVKALADGNVVENLTVTNGAITLPFAASKIIVGIPYSCVGHTLPLNKYLMRRKSIFGIGVRTDKTRGLAFGDSEEYTYPVKDRTTEGWGDPTELRSNMEVVAINSSWKEDAEVWFRQDHPLPATILGLVVDAAVGDDKSDSRRRDAD